MMYITIWLIVAGGYVIIVSFGGLAFKVSTTKPSLAGIHWVIAMCFGVGMILWDTMLKFIPDSFCP